MTHVTCPGCSHTFAADAEVATAQCPACEGTVRVSDVPRPVEITHTPVDRPCKNEARWLAGGAI